jgi:cytochrome c-type biogenesis protein CcmE
MTSKARIITGLAIILVFITIGFLTALNNKVEYVNFSEAQNKMKTVEVKGKWVKEKDAKYDTGNNTFTFYLKDDLNNESKVVFDGARPNNFEVADAVVVKGKMHGDHFQAKEILTKCPSKYEATNEDLKKSNQPK